jgi:hypothetical protein
MAPFKTGDVLSHRLNPNAKTVFHQYVGLAYFISKDAQYHFADDWYLAGKDSIVVLVENGSLKPATRPYVHSSRVLAETEARRLSEANPGKDFYVFELASKSSAPAPVATTKAA